MGGSREINGIVGIDGINIRRNIKPCGRAICYGYKRRISKTIVPGRYRLTPGRIRIIYAVEYRIPGSGCGPGRSRTAGYGPTVGIRVKSISGKGL